MYTMVPGWHTCVLLGEDPFVEVGVGVLDIVGSIKPEREMVGVLLGVRASLEGEVPNVDVVVGDTQLTPLYEVSPGWHAEQLFEPIVGAIKPGWHGVQTMLPLLPLYVPAVHGMH